MDYNKDSWRLIEAKVNEVIDAKVAATVAAHEAKAASETFANSHVPAASQA